MAIQDPSNFMASPLNKALEDKFLLVLNLPKALKSINSKTTRNNKTLQLDTLQFSIWGTVVPSINVPAVDMRYAGGNMPISSHSRPPWQPVTVNFNVDNMWNNYWVIYQWLNLLRSDEDGQFGAITDKQGLLDANAAMPEYSTDLTIYALDEYENQRIMWTYTYAFPTNLGEIAFTERSTNQFECSFTFQFSQLICTLI